MSCAVLFEYVSNVELESDLEEEVGRQEKYQLRLKIHLPRFSLLSFRVVELIK